MIHLVIIIKPLLLHFVYLLLSKIITKIFSGKAKRENIFDKEGMVLRYPQIMILGGTLGFETSLFLEECILLHSITCTLLYSKTND